MRKGFTLGSIIFISALTLILFQIKYKVVELEDQIKNVNAQVFLIEESIHVLKAEWSYRTSPRRLNQLAEKHLKLGLSTPLQFNAADSEEGLSSASSVVSASLQHKEGRQG